MPLSEKNTINFHRKTFAGQLETVTLLKRNNDQQEGAVRSYRLFQCRHSYFTKTGQQIAGDETANHQTVWHIPMSELKRVGFSYLNSLDRIVDKRGWYWQPESTTMIIEKLFRNHIDLNCLRVDPP